ncbi:hypothetical protein GCM10009689_04980 [Brevibacterium antiquum]
MTLAPVAARTESVPAPGSELGSEFRPEAAPSGEFSAIIPFIACTPCMPAERVNDFAQMLRQRLELLIRQRLVDHRIDLFIDRLAAASRLPRSSRSKDFSAQQAARLLEKVRQLRGLVTHVGMATLGRAGLVEFVSIIHIHTLLTGNITSITCTVLATFLATAGVVVILFAVVVRVHVVSFACHLTCTCIMTCI